MNEAAHIVRLRRAYALLIELYPDPYLAHHRQEMLADFDELARECPAPHLWLFLISDLLISVPSQHMHALRRSQQMNGLTMAAAILLSPALLVVSLEILARMAQRNLSHPNMAFSGALQHSFLYQSPILFLWVIVFPALAGILSLLSLLKFSDRRVPFSLAFLKSNALPLLLALLACGFLFVVKFHDLLPCLARGVVRGGSLNIAPLMSACRLA